MIKKILIKALKNKEWPTKHDMTKMTKSYTAFDMHWPTRLMTMRQESINVPPCSTFFLDSTKSTTFVLLTKKYNLCLNEPGLGWDRVHCKPNTIQPVLFCSILLCVIVQWGIKVIWYQISIQRWWVVIADGVYPAKY